MTIFNYKLESNNKSKQVSKQHLTQNHSKNSGYSLLELMIVTVLLGILIAMTYPSYVEHLQKTRRLAAKTTLINLAQQQERYFTENMTYAPNFKLLIDQENNTLTTQKGLYQFSLSTTQSDGNNRYIDFTLTAVPSTGKQQEQDTTCTKLTVDSIGNYKSQNNNDEDTSDKCWNL